jgi:hypothetical protein
MTCHGYCRVTHAIVTITCGYGDSSLWWRGRFRVGEAERTLELCPLDDPCW